ncbi:MAG: type IV pilus modification PilV family protein [Candidatus Loosdrechtia sp.]|uniref:type IV pilus modification PilV family protein n=1 Tax=Candidatus Loosdrechtia sp. TaxID=3101272 RepID=UPI003A698B0E|nr:MAG: type II secretion system protein [Candidatus Jettenia sp. AMX2]
MMKYILLLFKKVYYTEQCKRDRKPGNQRGYPFLAFKGFTILEIMVALVIMGISLSIFFSLVGNSSRLRGKIDEHTRLLLLARSKTEEVFLGILEGIPIAAGEKNILEGKTKDNIPWKITERNKGKEKKKAGAGTILSGIKNQDDDYIILYLPEGVMSVNTQIGMIDIDTVLFSRSQ